MSNPVWGLEVWAEAEVTKAQPDTGEAGTTSDTNPEGTPQ